MSKEDKTEKKETKNQSVDELVKSIDRLWASFRMLVKVCERHFGEDLNRDGKIGGARLSVLTALGIVMVCACIVGATQSYTAGDLFHVGKAKITADGTFSTDGGITADGAITASGAITGVAGNSIAGIATNGASVASADYGNLRKDTITISGTSIKLPNRPSSNGIYSVKISAWTTGRIYVVGVMMDDFYMTTNAASLTSTSHVTYALGTAAGANSSLSGTAVNLCPTGATVQATNTFDACLASPAAFDGTTTPVEMWLNVCVDSNYVATGTTNLTYGTIRVHSINLGDY